MFNRHAIGVRAHADGGGLKLANLSFMPARAIFGRSTSLSTPSGHDLRNPVNLQQILQVHAMEPHGLLVFPIIATGLHCRFGAVGIPKSPCRT